MENDILDVETAKTHLEKLMMNSPKDLTINDLRHYFAGYIEALHDFGIIDDEAREELYSHYAI